MSTISTSQTDLNLTIQVQLPGLPSPASLFPASFPPKIPGFNLPIPDMTDAVSSATKLLAILEKFQNALPNAGITIKVKLGEAVVIQETLSPLAAVDMLL